MDLIRSRDGHPGRRRSLERFAGTVTPLERRALLTTLFVDAQHTSGTPDGSQGNPYPMIQVAIDHATAPGDIVRIAPGTYAESLVINHPVQLLGPNAGINPNTGTRTAEAVVVPPVDSPYGGVALLVEANGVVIDGLSLDGHNDALGGGVVLNGTTVHSASGVSNVDSAGTLHPVSGLVVRNNIIRNFNHFGVLGDANDYAHPVPFVSTGNAIVNNRIDNMPTIASNPIGTFDQGRGISIEDDFYADVTGNVLTRVATGIQAIFHLDPSGSASPSTIGNNEVHAYDRGILVYTQDTDTATFAVSGNRVFAESVGASPTNVGIDIDRVLSQTTVALSNNDVTGAHIGIRLDYNPTTRGVNVAGGTLSANDYGVVLTNLAPPGSSTGPKAIQASLAGVTIAGSTVAGLKIENALTSASASVTLNVDTRTVVTGSPHGAILAGASTQLAGGGNPTLTFTSTPPAQSDSASAAFQFTASDSISTPNDLTYRYRLDGGAPVLAAGTLNLAGLSGGPHTLVLTASDQAGNVGTASFRWTVTTTTQAPPPAPSVPVLTTSSDTGTSKADGITKNPRPTFTGTAVPGVTVTLRAGTTLLGTTAADALGNWNLTIGGKGAAVPSLADGTFTVSATATDAAGQTGAPSSLRTIVIDTTPPTVKIVLTPPPIVTKKTTQVPVTISGTVADALSGPSSATYSFRDSSGRVVTSGSLTLATDGSYRVTATLPLASWGRKRQSQAFTLVVGGGDVAGNVGTSSVGLVISL